MSTIIFPWDEALNPQNRHPLAPIARAGRAGLCALYRGWPFIFFGTPGSPIENTPGNRQTQAFWDRLCAPEFVPPPNTRPNPFLGGQCAVLYVARFFVQRSDQVNPNQGSQVVLGPIQQIYWDYTPNFVVQNRTRIQGFVRGANGTLINVLDQVVDAPLTFNNWIVLERQDGLPDTCGNPPITFPQPLTIPPINVSVPIQIGPQIVNIPVSFPDVNVNNWPDFTFAPRVLIDGININLTAGGVEIALPPGTQIPPDSGSSVDLSPVLNAITQSELSINTSISEAESTINDNINDVESDVSALASLIRCCCCEENVTYDVQEIVSNTLGGSFALPPNTIAIRISGSNFNLDRIRTQDGSGDAPMVFYWGWYAVGYSGGFQGARSELQYQNQAVSTSEFASTVTVNPIYDARATIIAIVKNKNCSSED